jgi:hypothetical protein
MRLKNALSGMLVALAAGCVSYPPAAIVDGYFVNRQYAFALKMPEKWTLENSVPERFLPNNHRRPNEFGQRPSVQRSQMRDMYPNRPQGVTATWNIGVFSDSVFVNEAGTAVIALDVDKGIFDLSQKSIQAIQRMLERALSHEQSAVKGYIGAIEDLQYSISPECVTSSPALLARRSYRQGKLRCANKLYAFTVEEDDTCALNITLISEEEAFEENLAVFNRITKTLDRCAPEPPSKR